jgi:type VI secretion system secreted protein Hcp
MKYRMLSTLILAVGFGVATSLAQADTFMLVPGVQGDSFGKGRDGWIRVSRLEWGVDAETSWTKGGGASVGKPNPGKLVLKLANGPWANAFLRAIGRGTTLDGGVAAPILIDHAAGDGRVAIRFRLEGVFVTRYGMTTNAQEAPIDQLDLVFKSIRMENNHLGTEGKVPPSSFDWDIPAGMVK